MSSSGVGAAGRAVRPVGPEVVGLPLQILRSDGAWYHVTIESYNAVEKAHVLQFVDGDGRPISSRVYDLNHPARKLRWYDASKKLLPIGSPPPLLTAPAVNRERHTSNLGVGSRHTHSAASGGVDDENSEVVWSRGSSAYSAASSSASATFSARGGGAVTTVNNNNISSGGGGGGSGSGSSSSSLRRPSDGRHSSNAGSADAARSSESTAIVARISARRNVSAEADDSSRLVRIGTEVFAVSELRSGSLLFCSTSNPAKRYVRLRARAVSAAPTPLVDGAPVSYRRRVGTNTSDDGSGSPAIGSFVLPDSSRLPPSARDPLSARSVEGGGSSGGGGGNGGNGTASPGSGLIGSSSGGASSPTASALAAAGNRLVRVYVPPQPSGRSASSNRPVVPIPPEGWRAKQVCVFIALALLRITSASSVFILQLFPLFI